MTHNSTNNTQQHKQHITPPVSLCAICVDTRKCVPEEIHIGNVTFNKNVMTHPTFVTLIFVTFKRYACNGFVVKVKLWARNKYLHTFAINNINLLFSGHCHIIVPNLIKRLGTKNGGVFS